ncbi:hypothetical protein EL09_15295 [Salmonella enterica subsp. enterica]|nr:hypothetical protein [Salmonella enterica subsp. enterica]MIF51080.1 hypothetical protein [Salmonella enterica subsp. enterica]
MPGSKNAVERKLAEVESLWLDASDNDDARFFIWRTAADSDRLIQVFFALQQEGQNDYTTPDLFVHFTTPFETAYGYSHALEQEFIERVNISSFPEPHWSSDGLTPCYRGDVLFSLLNDFARHHQDCFRYLAVLLTPAAISHSGSFHGFLDELCRASAAVPSYLRFILVDTNENPAWQGLADRFPETVRVLTPEISEDELMRQTLNETPTTDGTAMLRFRQVMVDSFISLKKGPAVQTEKFAQKALALARQNGWWDQQVVVFSMIAGGWLKEKNTQNAIKNYRLAVQHAERLPDESRHTLTVQCLMGEGNAWFMEKDYRQASDTFHRSAVAAQNMPSLLLEMESHRMAGFSLMAASPAPEETAQHYHAALLTGLSMSEEERATSGFMQIFRDLLNHLSPDAAARCTRFAEQYVAEQAELVRQAELAVSQAASPDIAAVVPENDRELEQKTEALFQRTLLQREQMLIQESSLYRQLLCLARYHSHVFWTPGTEIAHPLNKPSGEWPFAPLLAVPEIPPTKEDTQAMFGLIFPPLQESQNVGVEA